MKKYVKPEAKEARFDFETNIAIILDPNTSTGENLVKDRDGEFDSDEKSNDNEWTSGLW